MDILDFGNVTCLTLIVAKLLTILASSEFYKVCIVGRILSYTNNQVTKPQLRNGYENLDVHKTEVNTLLYPDLCNNCNSQETLMYQADEYQLQNNVISRILQAQANPLDI